MSRQELEEDYTKACAELGHLLVNKKRQDTRIAELENIINRIDAAVGDLNKKEQAAAEELKVSANQEAAIK